MAKDDFTRVLAVVAAAALAAALLGVLLWPTGNASAQTCVQPPSGMTGWWPGDGNTDDIVGDRNAVLRDNATFGAGHVGDAFVLDGSGDFVEVPHDPALNIGTGDFTVDFWVYFNDLSGEQILVEKYIERFDPSTSGWTITKLPDNVVWLFGQNGSVDFGTVPNTNTWIHYALRRQAGVLTAFVNGVPVASATSINSNGDSTSSLKFGRRGSPSDTPGSLDNRGFFLNGRIDEVELFVGRALSDSEIQAIYNAGSAGKCKPGTDTTPPTLDLPPDITEEATGPNGAAVNYNATATDEDPANPEVTCTPTSGSTFPIGTTKVNCSAKDAAGNEATGSFNVTVRDTTPPEISGVPSDITATATGSSGAVVSYASPTATDLVDGSVDVSCSPASGSTFALGETTVSCTASDTRNNTATKTFKVTVLYNFKGFFSPVDNLPTLNSMQAGPAVPVKFSLGGDQGLDIFEATYPKSQQISCDPTAPVDGIEQTETANESGLTYDTSTGQYNYVWKTNKAWAKSCRQLVMKLKDGSFQRANFKFK